MISFPFSFGAGESKRKNAYIENIHAALIHKESLKKTLDHNQPFSQD